MKKGKGILDSFEKLSFYSNVELDLNKLDGSQLKYIIKALERIQESNGDIGEYLRGDLQGYKKVKLRKDGLRIVFKKVENKIIVANIVTIGKRENKKVYEEAVRRLFGSR